MILHDFILNQWVDSNKKPPRFCSGLIAKCVKEFLTISFQCKSNQSFGKAVVVFLAQCISKY